MNIPFRLKPRDLIVGPEVAINDTADPERLTGFCGKLGQCRGTAENLSRIASLDEPILRWVAHDGVETLPFASRALTLDIHEAEAGD